MARGHSFGGIWTETKLRHLRKYLDAYMKIFTANEKARYYKTIYVDAFAGTGYRAVKPSDLKTIQMFPTADELKAGSAVLALRTEPPFSRYVFVELNKDRALELEQLRSEFPDRNIEVHCGDANEALLCFCHETDWNRHRAVVFLDPHGMSVDFETLKALGQTLAIDLWYLFPLSIGAGRLLSQSPPEEESWSMRLTKIFGTEEWKTKFYAPSKQLKISGGPTGLEKRADYDSMLKFFKEERLGTIFHKIAKKHRLLMNSKNSPMFALLFASANPKKSDLAVKIANNIFKD